MINSEIIILLSTISTGILALIALCIKYIHLSNCYVFKGCWGCLYWEKDPSEHNREIALTHPPIVPISPNNNENLNSV